MANGIMPYLNTRIGYTKSKIVELERELEHRTREVEILEDIKKKLGEEE